MCTSYFILPTSSLAAVPQFTVTVYAQVLALFAASLAVHVTVVGPEGRLVGALFVRLVTAQLSEAVGLANWLFGKPQGLPLPETVVFGGQVITGNCPSLTVTVNEQVWVWLEPSMARHTTVVMPVGNVEPLAKPLNRLTCTLVQLSDPVGIE